MTPTQLATVLFLAFVLAVMMPIYRNRRQKGSKPLLSRLMGHKKETDQPSKDDPQLRNGTKLDLLATANMVIKIVNTHKWFVILPGYAVADGKKATLSGIILTHQGVVAFKCYGFGGKIISRTNNWEQQMNGTIRTLPNIEEDCKNQEIILSRALAQCGLEQLSLQICAVFTTDGVDLSQAKPGLCFTRDSFADYLLSPKHNQDTGLDPQKTGRILSEHVVRK